MYRGVGKLALLLRFFSLGVLYKCFLLLLLLLGIGLCELGIVHGIVLK